jgi:hypothetical protein
VALRLPCNLLCSFRLTRWVILHSLRKLPQYILGSRLAAGGGGVECWGGSVETGEAECWGGSVETGVVECWGGSVETEEAERCWGGVLGVDTKNYLII